MPEPTVDSNKTAANLLTKLDKLELTPEERALLRAILTVAQEVTIFKLERATEATDPEGETSFRTEFAAAFTSDKAELISAYANALRPGMVGKVTTGVEPATPAMVGR